MPPLSPRLSPRLPPRLSLCVIAGPPATELERCLDSVAAMVDEVVVVVMGDDAAVLSVARTRTQQVIQLDQVDQVEDFAKVRNQALESANGDWILMMNGNEELSLEWAPLLRDALLAADIAAYQVLVEERGLSTPPVQRSQVRLYRRSPEIRYERPVYEHLLEGLQRYLERTGMRMARLPVVIHHHRATPAREEARRAMKQRVLSQALSQQPDDPFLLYKRALNARTLLPEEAREDLARACEILLACSPGELHAQVLPIEVFAQRIQDLGVLEGDSAALEFCEVALERVGEHPLLSYLYAVLLWRLELFDRCQEALELCIATGEDARGVDYPAQEVLSRANFMLGELLFRQGFLMRADQHFARTLEFDPRHVLSRACQLRVRALSGDVATALQACVAWVKQEGEPEAALLCYELLMGLGRLDMAERWAISMRRDFAQCTELLQRLERLRQSIPTPQP